MNRYAVNNRTDSNPNNNHEVHNDTCQHWPLSDARDLGYHSNCQSAMIKARQIYSNADGCSECCSDCHNR